MRAKSTLTSRLIDNESCSATSAPSAAAVAGRRRTSRAVCSRSAEACAARSPDRSWPRLLQQARRNRSLASRSAGSKSRNSAIASARERTSASRSPASRTASRAISWRTRVEAWSTRTRSTSRPAARVSSAWKSSSSANARPGSTGCQARSTSLWSCVSPQAAEPKRATNRAAGPAAIAAASSSFRAGSTDQTLAHPPQDPPMGTARRSASPSSARLSGGDGVLLWLHALNAVVPETDRGRDPRRCGWLVLAAVRRRRPCDRAGAVDRHGGRAVRAGEGRVRRACTTGRAAGAEWPIARHGHHDRALHVLRLRRARGGSRRADRRRTRPPGDAPDRPPRSVRGARRRQGHRPPQRTGLARPGGRDRPDRGDAERAAAGLGSAAGAGRSRRRRDPFTHAAIEHERPDRHQRGGEDQQQAR